VHIGPLADLEGEGKGGRKRDGGGRTGKSWAIIPLNLPTTEWNERLGCKAHGKPYASSLVIANSFETLRGVFIGWLKIG